MLVRPISRQWSDKAYTLRVTRWSNRIVVSHNTCRGILFHSSASAWEGKPRQREKKEEEEEEEEVVVRE